jgi:putative phage-type endonuclease
MSDTIEQRSDEWHQQRLGKVTASRIADVLATIKTGEAASRAEYRIELVCERLTGKPTESYSNAHMERGVELEPFARAWYEVERGVFVRQVSFVDHPFIELSGASPDGLVDDDGMLEIKCPMVKTHIKTLIDRKIPAKYIPQMQWQMACTGRQWNDFVSYCPEMPQEMQLFVKRLERDNEYIAELETKVKEFLAEVSTTLTQLEGLNHGSSI